MASLLSFSLPKPATSIARASSSSSSLSEPSLSTPSSLNDAFGRKGIKFSESNATPTVELTVRNGSSVKLNIPSAHVTSYKPRVHWKDDGFEEVLYTINVGSGENEKVKGGIGLVINDASEKGSNKASLLSASDQWSVKDTDSDAIDALQVELGCTSGPLELTYIVSLYPLSMATAVIVKNTSRKDVTLSPAILSHLLFKKRAGAGIQGLRGCSYCSHPPLSSPLEILTPAEAMKPDELGMFSFSSDSGEKPGTWNVQDVPITILKDKLSRVYAAPPSERLKPVYNTAPSKFETLDQGRELFFRMIRVGFEDFYISSPGSFSSKYGKDYFICTGPASMLLPVVVKPGEDWRGAQVIEHDNL